MKKIIIAIGIIFIGSSFQNAKLEQKPLILQGDLQTFQTLYNSIGNGKIEAQTMTDLKEWILKQIQPQIVVTPDSTKTQSKK
jgi:hypothetical protein